MRSERSREFGAWLAASLGVLAAGLLLVAGCAPEFDGQTCSDDSDCFQGEACIDGRCRLVGSDDTSGRDTDRRDTAADTGAEADGDAPGPSVARIELEPQFAEIEVGETAVFTATAFDASGEEIFVDVDWSSSETSVASVSDGSVTANETGTAEIVASAQGVRDTAVAKVVPRPVDSVRIVPSDPVEVSTGNDVQLTAMPVDSDGNDLCSKSEARGTATPCGRDVVWTSGDSSVATVDATGLVTGRATGSTTVFATIAGAQASRQVSVKPSANNPPSVSTKGDRDVTVGDTVDLDASSTTDPDGDSLQSFQWSFQSRPSNSTASLTNPNQAQASFPADKTGQYTLQVTVTDQHGASASATVTITSRPMNTAPSADAGSDQVVNVGGTANLDGTGSSDPDGGPSALSFSWTFLRKPSNSTATLMNASTDSPSFQVDRAGRYRVELTADDGRATDTDTVVVRGNRTPTAEAGSDITITVGNTAQLSAASSTDLDGDSLSYSWTFTQTPGATTPSLNDGSTATPSFMVGDAGGYTLEVTVDDGNAVDTDTVTVTGNTAPTAYAGADQTVEDDVSVSLDATGSFDPDTGDTISYSWSFTSTPSGASPTLSPGASDPQPSFTPGELGTYTLLVRVSDGRATTEDSVTVTAKNDSPTADAGPDQTVTSGSTVTLDGTGSSDPNSQDTISYSWTQTSGPSVSLSDATASQPTFSASSTGTYVFELTVTDNHGASSSTDSVTITVN